MTTATILSVDRTDGDFTVTYLVSANGREAKFKLIGGNLTPQQVQTQIKMQAKAFENSAATDTLMGAVDLTDTIIPPTQAELDRDAWVALYRKWVKVKTTLVDTGILVGNEAALATLKNKVQTDFRLAYLDYI